MAERLVKTIYHGKGGTVGRASSASIEGAVKAAALRLLDEQYDRAEIYDLRFGGRIEDGKNHVLALVRERRSLDIRWFSHALFKKDRPGT